MQQQLPIKAKDSIYRSLYFNSSNRAFGDNDNPVFALDPAINSTEKIKVLAVNIPLSYYTFDNYTLRLNENTAGSLFSQININGNFSNSQLTSYITTALNTASSSTGSSLTYNCAYDSILGKLTIQASGGNFVVTSGTANANLGFRSPSSTPAPNQTSDSVIQLSKQYIVVQSDELQQSIATSSRSYYNNDSSQPIAAVIPIINSQYQYQYYESPVSSEYLKSNTSVLERISFRLTDLDGNRVSLNGVPWSIKVGVITEPFH